MHKERTKKFLVGGVVVLLVGTALYGLTKRGRLLVPAPETTYGHEPLPASDVLVSDVEALRGKRYFVMAMGPAISNLFGPARGGRADYGERQIAYATGLVALAYMVAVPDDDLTIYHDFENRQDELLPVEVGRGYYHFDWSAEDLPDLYESVQEQIYMPLRKDRIGKSIDLIVELEGTAEWEYAERVGGPIKKRVVPALRVVETKP